jgi:adenylate cyclase
VVFVDLRGYSAYTEDLPPERIFSTVNRYTLRVSDAIARHGGTVVEFGGDGMMAVFGAPEALPRKEAAALGAARDVVAGVAALGAEDGASLGVGVGVATGPAWVGSVGSADRLLWTALGNTTNLASRLQALTRELGAAVVIDEPTWRAVGDAGVPFQRHLDIAIRGRKRPETVYALA